jgi:hypothetical protein
MASGMPPESRRPIRARQQVWAHTLAHVLVGAGMTPNQMSMASVAAAVLGAMAYGGAALARSAGAAYLVAAAIFIQLRLLANLLDGLMAIEEARRTPTGVLYNEFPDRIADTVLLVATGYASGWPDLGWLAAVLAIATRLHKGIRGLARIRARFLRPDGQAAPDVHPDGRHSFRRLCGRVWHLADLSCGNARHNRAWLCRDAVAPHAAPRAAPS